MNKTNYKPIGPFILVKEIKMNEEKTNSGLVISNIDESNKKLCFGIVINHGTGVMLSNGFYTKFNTQIGQQVLFRKSASFKVELDGEIFYQLYEIDILGVYYDEIENEETKYVSDIADSVKQENE